MDVNPDIITMAQYDAPHCGLNRRAMTRVVAYIDENLGEELSLGALAGVASTSRGCSG